MIKVIKFRRRKERIDNWYNISCVKCEESAKTLTLDFL